jgi:hypothetical protein
MGCESSEEGNPFQQDHAGEEIPFWEQSLLIVGTSDGTCEKQDCYRTGATLLDFVRKPIR